MDDNGVGNFLFGTFAGGLGNSKFINFIQVICSELMKFFFSDTGTRIEGVKEVELQLERIGK